MHWSIACAASKEHGSGKQKQTFRIRLASESETVVADVTVCREREGMPHDHVFDPAVAVVACESDDARAWLAAPEHEYFIAELLLGGRT